MGNLTSLILLKFMGAVLAIALCSMSERDEREGVGDDDNDDNNTALTSGITRPTLLRLVPSSGTDQRPRLYGFVLSALWGGGCCIGL